MTLTVHESTAAPADGARQPSLWRNRDFVTFWTGETLSLLGSQVTNLALPFTAIYTFNASGQFVGILRFLELVPYLGLALLFGVWVDRVSRRRVMLGANLARMTLIAAVPLLHWAGVLDLPVLLVVACAVGVASVLFDVSWMPFVPVLVKDPRHYVEANAKIGMSQSVADVSGPGIAVFFIAALSAPVALIVDAASYLVSVCSLLLIRTQETVPPRGARRHLLRELREGLDWVFGRPILRWLAVVGFCCNFSLTAVWTLFLLYGSRQLHLGSFMMGAVLAAASVGGLIGAMSSGRVIARFPLGRAYFVAQTGLLLGPMVMVLAGGPKPAVVTLLIVSFFTTYLGLGVANVIIVSLRQATTPQPMMSRMTACFRTLLYGGGALGALTAGLLAGAIGTKQALVAAAVASAAVVVALLLSPVTRLRELPDVVTAPGEGRRGQAVTSGTTVTGPTVPPVDGPAPAPLRALLLENIHPDAAARLAEAGCEIQARAGVLSEDELIEAVRGVSLLGIRSRTHVTERVLAAAPHLVAVGAFCVGVNQIDLAAAARRGIAVFNAPFSNTRSVVELVLAEIIALARRLPEKNAGMHAGRWDKSASGSHEVRGRRLGIVGYGNIGAQLSVLAESLGMSVYFYDIADKQALGNARRCGSLDELLDSVDTVTVHVDGRPGNRGLFGEAEFARMRPRSLFLNLSRGFVVDHQALRRSIESDHLAGAAVDVFPDEPDGKGEEFVSGLRGLPNVILTPHVGGSTEEAQQDIGEFVAGKLRDYVRAGTTSLSVNLPGIALPAAPGTHQLVHIHQNVPGVLASVNRLLADHGVNVQGQMLGTRNDIGYAITNVATEYSAEVLAKLRAMDVTIRLRTIPITTEILHESAPSVRVSA